MRQLKALSRTPSSLFFVGLLTAACGSEDPKDAEPEGELDEEKPAPENEPDPCIPSKEAGDHVFRCNDLTFLTKVDASCLDKPCGLIFDVHGLTMSGQQMRDNTELHELAPKAGYITVHPSAPGAGEPGAPAAFPGGVWSASLYPHVLDFMQRAIEVYGIDKDRVHITGFSQGGALTWWFVCNHSDLIASAAPNAAAGLGGEKTCIDEAWAPRIPILYMNGETDTASKIADARTLASDISTALSLEDQGQVAGDEGFTRQSYADDQGMQFDYIEHKYGGQAVLAGHCIPGGVDFSGAANNYGANATTCSEGDPSIHWGELVLEFFQKHPRKAAN